MARRFQGRRRLLPAITPHRELAPAALTVRRWRGHSRCSAGASCLVCVAGGDGRAAGGGRAAGKTSASPLHTHHLCSALGAMLLRYPSLLPSPLPRLRATRRVWERHAAAARGAERAALAASLGRRGTAYCWADPLRLRAAAQQAAPFAAAPFTTLPRSRRCGREGASHSAQRTGARRDAAGRLQRSGASRRTAAFAAKAGESAVFCCLRHELSMTLLSFFC